MKVMFDINVVLDIVGRRHPFYDDSRAAFLKAVEINASPMLAVHAYPTLFYLLGAIETRAVRSDLMEWIFSAFGAAKEGSAELTAARSYGMGDLEDALVAATAESAECDCIVTRNAKDFALSPVTALTPAAFINK